MTWSELCQLIAEMSDEQKQMDVTIYVAENEEFFPVDSLKNCEESNEDSLDPGHPFLVIN
jgi:hypothetical protein